MAGPSSAGGTVQPIVALLAALTLSCAPVHAAGPGGENAIDLSSYAMKSDLSSFATTDALNAAMVNATNNASTKLAAVPAVGPGTGKCRFSVVPSNLIQSGGVTGTTGTCSRIVQCGTSGAYVVAQFNIGDGC